MIYYIAFLAFACIVSFAIGVVIGFYINDVIFHNQK